MERMASGSVVWQKGWDEYAGTDFSESIEYGDYGWLLYDAGAGAADIFA